MEDGQGRIAIAGKQIAATLADCDDAKLAQVHGQDEPRLGWAYPGDRERTAVWTAVLSSRAKDATFATTLALGGEPLTVTGAAVEPDRIEVGLDGAPDLIVSLDGRRALVVQ